MRLPLITLLASAALALAAPALAGAHVEIQPRQAIGGETVTYTLIIYPHTSAQLVGMTATLPTAIRVTAATAGDGLSPRLVRSGDRVTSIVWSGSASATEPNVTFTAKTGLRQQTLVIPTVLRFIDGSSESWRTARTTVLGYTDLRPPSQQTPTADGGSRRLLPYAAALAALVLVAAVVLQRRSRRG